MKLFIWLAIGSLTSALPQKRFSSEESSKVVSDISKIVPKLPEQIKVEILQSSKENPHEELFQIVNRNPNDDSSEYIIGGKRRYRVKIKKKSVESGGKRIKVTATNNTYKYERVSGLSNPADQNTKDVSQNYVESQGSANEFGDFESAMKANADRNVYALNGNAYVGVTDYIKPYEINQPKVKKFRVSTQRTKHTKRTRIKSGSKFGTQEIDDNSQIPKVVEHAQVPEVVQNICKYLNIKPEDVWLLANTYLNLDINTPRDLNTLKHIYQGFVNHVKNNLNTKNISSFKEWLKQSKYWNKNIPQFWYEEPAKELGQKYSISVKPKLETNVITYPEVETEINYEWVEGDPNHKILKSRPIPGSIVHVTEKIQRPDDILKLRSMYQDYLLSQQPNAGNVITFEEWLESRQNSIKIPEVSHDDLNLNEVVYQHLENSPEFDEQTIAPNSEIKTKNIYNRPISSMEKNSQSSNKPIGFKYVKEQTFTETPLQSTVLPGPETEIIQESIGNDYYPKDFENTNIPNNYTIKEMKENQENYSSVPNKLLNKDKPKATTTITSKDIPDPGYLKIQKPNQELTHEDYVSETNEVTSTKEWLNTNSEYVDKHPIYEVTTQNIDTDNLKELVASKTEPSSHDQASIDLNPANEYTMNLPYGVPDPGYLKIQKPNLEFTNEDHEPETKKVISTKEWLDMNSEYFDKQKIYEATSQKIDTENVDEPIESKKMPSNHDQASLDLYPSDEYAMNLPSNVSDPGYHKIQNPSQSIEVTTSKFDPENLKKPVKSDTVPSKHNQEPLELNSKDEFPMNLPSNESNAGTSEIFFTEDAIPEFNKDYQIDPQKSASTTISNNLGSTEYSTKTYKNEEIETEINNYTNQDTVVKAKSQLGGQSEPLVISPVDVAKDAPKGLTSKQTIKSEEFDVGDFEKQSETKRNDTDAYNEALSNNRIPPFIKLSDKDANIAAVEHILSSKKIVEPIRADEIDSSLSQQKPTNKINNLVKYDGPDQSSQNYKEIETVKQMPYDIAEDPLFAPHLFKPLEVDPTSLQQESGSTKLKEDHVNHILNTRLPIIIKKIARLHPSKSRHDVYREVLLKLIKMFPEIKRVIKREFTLLDNEYYGLNPSLFDEPKSDTQFEELAPIGSSEIVPEIQIPRPNILKKMLRTKPNMKETTLEEFLNFFDPSNKEKSKIEDDIDDTLNVEHAITGDQVRKKLFPGVRSNKKDPNTSYFLLVPSTVIEDEEFKNTPWYKFIMKSDGALSNDIPSKTQKYPDLYSTKLRSKQIMPTINDPVEILLHIHKPDYAYQYRLLANDILKRTSRHIFYYLMSARVPKANVISIINRINSEMTVHINKYVSSDVCPSNDLNGFINMLKLKIKKYIIGSSR